MHQKITSIVRVFPEFEERIDFLFRTDENFRDLCTDHILCTSTIMNMKEEPNKFSDQILEYEEVLKGLEGEILQMISTKKSIS